MNARTYALEQAAAITPDTSSMFDNRGIVGQEVIVMGILREAGAIGQAWGLCAHCWKIGPMAQACGGEECWPRSHQFRPVAFGNKVRPQTATWGSLTGGSSWGLTPHSRVASGTQQNAYMYEFYTWFIAMWKHGKKLDEIEARSLMAEIKFYKTFDSNAMGYDTRGPPGIIDLRDHISREIYDDQPQDDFTSILKKMIDTSSVPSYTVKESLFLLDWARRSVLAEKEIVNIALRENYLLKQNVQILQGQALMEGEEDVRRKRPRVTQTGSDDHKGHTDQEGQEPPAGDSCTIL